MSAGDDLDAMISLDMAIARLTEHGELASKTRADGEPLALIPLFGARARITRGGVVGESYDDFW